MSRSAYTSSRQLYRLLHSRRPAESRLCERQHPVWDELAKAVGDRDHFQQLHIAISDGESDWAWMREQQLLLAIGTICQANDRPDIWRQIYAAWEAVPAPGGEVTLLDDLLDQARRGEI
jgi:hypothetical protein